MRGGGCSRPQVGRSSRGGGGAQAGLAAYLRTINGVFGAAVGQIQIAEKDRLHRRTAAQDRDGKDPQASAAGAVLGGEREKGAGVKAVGSGAGASACQLLVTRS